MTHHVARAASMLIAMSASMKLMPCCAAIGLPNAWRSCVTQRLRPAPYARRPRRGCHRRAGVVKDFHGDQEALTLVPQPVFRRHTHILQHDLARPGGVLAHLGNRLAQVTPGQSRSTMNALMPRCLASGSVLAKIMKKLETGALVIQVLVPLRMYSSPWRTAVLRMPATSEPAAGSVRP